MLIEQIKSARMEAMKARNGLKSKILALVIGECDTKQDYSDKIVKSNLKKLVDSNREFISKLPAGDIKVQALSREIEILQEFLPQALTGPELEVAVLSIISSNSITNMSGMGLVMSKLNETGLLVDGKEVRGVFAAAIAS